MTFLRIITFTLEIMLVGLFAFIIYIIWLVRKKVERSGVFYDIYSWLLIGMACIQAYGLLAALISLFVFELSNSLIVGVLHLPWIFFSVCIYKVGRKLWNAIKEFGLSE